MRTEPARVAEDRAALRRVAMLVARGVPPEELFDAVSEEVGAVFGADLAVMARFEDDESMTIFPPWSAGGAHLDLPSRLSLEGATLPKVIRDTGRSAREDAWDEVEGEVAALARDRLGIRSVVGSPVIVEGRVWGVLYVASTQVPHMAADTESRLETFTMLVAAAVAHARARGQAQRLADEQAALRRVATLVAREASQAEVFAAIAEEIEQLLGAEGIRMVRYEDDRSALVVASAGAHTDDAFQLGTRHSLGGDNATSVVFRTGRAVRIDDYQRATGPIAEAVRAVGVRAVVCTPIRVEGRLWGAMIIPTTGDECLPPDTESRLTQFTELMATAVANAEARSHVQRLAEEQAALRRVATLVAEGASPTAVFDAVAAEMGALLQADGVALSRYEPGDEVTFVAIGGRGAELISPGSRLSHQGESVTASVWRTRRPARIEDYRRAPGAIAEVVRAAGIRACVGAPVVVDGRLWGAIQTTWGGGDSPPADTEERMVQFAELLETAIANADGRDQLTASRARLLTEADEARRRVVRDLHDGAQQRFVQAILTLKLAQHAVREHDANAESLLAIALEQAEQGNAELRELAHGILPPVLTRGGLRAGVNSVVQRLDLPVGVDVPAERFPEEIEASAYFIVAEALTNVVKHAHATRAEVKASVEDRMLCLEIRDDGIGGADPTGHGLVGMSDRVTALGGLLKVENPSGGGTLVAATLPLSDLTARAGAVKRS